MKATKGLFRNITMGVLLLLSTPLHAGEILFAFVERSGPYIPDGQSIASFANSAPGLNVTQRFLSDAVYTDYSSFDQIWIYDLMTGSNNNATQAANYARIANWFNTRDAEDQNLITDGRIISSAPRWTNANGMSSEQAWIANYATQLDARGGGLVLGTDHATPNQSTGVFVDGINEINRQIGIDPFFSKFGSFPTSQALVDVNSPLYIAGLDICRGTAGEPCINDNSTTSFAPAGVQAVSGLELTPVAYHGTTSDAFSNAAVSSTMGSITFGTCGGPGQEPCAQVPEPSTIGLLGLGLLGLGLARRKKA